jgi:hypothetical protein
VFISHSSQDKPFVTELAWILHNFKFDVWYDDWEIAVGDSIVDKVFEGLKASDTLIVVLSSASVASRWVREELNSTVMRKISENDVRILPVLIETCDIPMPLRHIRYADFRNDYEESFSALLDSLSPGCLLWQSLSHLYDHFCLLSDQFATSDLDVDARDKILKIHSLLESALNLRTEIEFRRNRQKMRDLSFFEKIGLLVEQGVDVRSQTWNAVVRFRAALAHTMKNYEVTLYHFAEWLKEGDNSDNIRQSLISGMERLKTTMHMLCFDRWEYEKIASPTLIEHGAGHRSE